VLAWEPVAATLISLLLGEDVVTAGLLLGGVLVVAGVLLATSRSPVASEHLTIIDR
jgi:drug/metabolite transporter (DMT)-like permease